MCLVVEEVDPHIKKLKAMVKADLVVEAMLLVVTVLLPPAAAAVALDRLLDKVVMAEKVLFML
tara:strand:- start:68 stop:256 length:189 start_codon:yes stop_codon:yes gene_type:complete